MVAPSRSLENQRIHVTTPRATRRTKCPSEAARSVVGALIQTREGSTANENRKIEKSESYHYATISTISTISLFRNKAEICCKDVWFEELQVLIYGVMQNYAKHACMIMIDHECTWDQFWRVNFQVLLHILHWPMQALERLCRQARQDIFSVCHWMESWHLFPEKTYEDKYTTIWLHIYIYNIIVK